MPTSNLSIAPAILSLIHQVPHRRVLDFGCGAGKYAVLMREMCNVKPEFIAAVEGEPSYLDLFPYLPCLYDEIRVEDIMTTDPDWLATFDLVLSIDSLEHLTFDDAMTLLDRIPGRAIICTPEVYFDNPPELGWTERHRSVFSVADFGDRVELDVSQLGGVIVLLKPKEPT